MRMNIITRTHNHLELYNYRIKDAHNDAMELKRQLYSIEGQVNDVKRHLHHLQEQKCELTRVLHEQECELGQIITGGHSKDKKEDYVS